MHFKRQQSIEHCLTPKRALVIYGPRRVGKTTLLQEFLGTQTPKRIFSATGDDLRLRELFAKQSLDALKDFATPYDLIAIDEAQQVPFIGLGTKMLIDTFPEKQIILTGSSSFDLSSQVGEPLTGRHFTLTLLPLSQKEMQSSRFEIEGLLEQTLRFGSYPEVLNASDNTMREKILNELISSYLYKDVLALEKIKSPDLLRDITRMIALQIGSEVSLNEIAVALHTDVKTVGRYLDILEKMFVIKRVRGFSRNLRNEISKKARYYFLDNGVRNAVIGNFTPLASRADTGALWENFCFMELVKRDNLSDITSTMYFWRTHQGQEIDIIREAGARLTAYECKWGTRSKKKIPKLFSGAYPSAQVFVMTPDNYLDLLGESES